MNKCPVYTLDFETDPFERGVTVMPFVWGLFDGAQYWSYWNDDPALCVRELVRLLKKLQPGIVYAHNGGRFDFTFMLPYLSPDVRVIDGRIVQCWVHSQELRDSFSILPLALNRLGDKGRINTKWLRLAVRHNYEAKIHAYLKTDCIELHNAVVAYRSRFGSALTMATAAFGKLQDHIRLETGTAAHLVLERLTLEQDREFRVFFYGGRTEYFEKGILKSDWRMTDKNSMYPFVMARYQHPVGKNFLMNRTIDDRTDFADIEAESRGALPIRLKNGSVKFPHGRFRFRVTGHEIRTAMDLGLIDIVRVNAAYRCPLKRDFSSFVDTYYKLRQEAARDGDTDAELHYKLVLNSTSGRFALNPDRLEDWTVLPLGESAGDGWEPRYIGQDCVFWSRPTDDKVKSKAIKNVATGASITGAARAELMRALARVERPIYCDTDAVICRTFDMPTGTELDQWKLLADADEAAIVHAKAYALFKDGVPVKHACAGEPLTPDQLRRAAAGENVRFASLYPSINPAGVQKYRSPVNVRIH